jgi:hypothetical protein
MKQDNVGSEYWESLLARGDELQADEFPQLYSLSSKFFYRFLPQPKHLDRLGFLYLPTRWNAHGSKPLSRIAEFGLTSTWNTAWESGQLRAQLFANDERPELKSLLERFPSLFGKNIQLFSSRSRVRTAYAPLYSMLDSEVLSRNGLPAFRRMLLQSSPIHDETLYLPADFNARFAAALSQKIWPFLDSGSPAKAFAKDHSLKLLSHSPEFWAPLATRIAQDRLYQAPFCDFEDEKEKADFGRMQQALAEDKVSDVNVSRCRVGTHAWYGKEEASQAFQEMVNLAEEQSGLGEIIDAIRSNQVEEDFSSRWSYAREDFERKLYSKRSRVKVKFVELKEADGVLGPHTEVHDNLLWQDFFAVLNPKEKEIVVCLAKGATNLSEVADQLGYKNHSPISKALTKIRIKAKKLIED